MTNVISVAEHDYATYTIINAMQSDDGVDGESQIVYQVQDLLQDEQIEGVDNISYDGASYQLITTDDADVVESTSSIGPRYRREISAGISGYWNEDDVNRLLKIYFKHMRRQPRMKGKPNSVTWNAIFREFDTKKKFTKAQIKTKILRLRSIGRNILKNGHAEKTIWPFWKQISEILELEKGEETGDEPMKEHAAEDPWSLEDLKVLLNYYYINAAAFRQSTSRKRKRETWEKIALAMGRDHYLVMVKFKKIRAKWKKWHFFGCPETEPLIDILKRFGEINLKIKRNEYVANADPNETTASTLMSFREKWSSDETERMLEVYVELLRSMQAPAQVNTRRAVYKLVSKRINMPTQAIQVKITSLKGHYKKYLMISPRERTNWRYAGAMEKVMRYENAIWTQMENNQTGDDLVEPEWFRHYRQDVEKRHAENICVLERLLNVMQQLS